MRMFTAVYKLPVELVLRAQKLLHAVVHAHGKILFGGGDKTLNKQGVTRAGSKRIHKLKRMKITSNQ